MTRPRYGLQFLVCAALLAPATAVTVNVTVVDGAGEGFNDPTLGAQRLAALQFAANHWGNLIDGTVPIELHVQFDPLGGTATSATLAFAGPQTANQNFTNAPMANTFYVSALANQLAGSDLNPAGFDIDATFNSDVDGNVVLGTTVFYYGTDANPPAGTLDFVSTAIHELGHGFGFLSLLNQDGTFATSNPDIYSQLMILGSTATSPSVATLTQAQRQTAQISDNLFSFGTGTRVIGNGANAKLFAPTTFQPGSSTSHLDEGTYTGSDEMMTPFATGTTHEFGPVARAMFSDFGYAMSPDWSNAAGGDFNAIANWNVMESPGPGDVLSIALAGTYTATASSDTTFRSLALGAGSGTQTLALGANALTATDTVNVAANGRVTMSTGSLSTTNGTTIAGGLTGAGTVGGPVTNNGFVAPGQSPGVLTLGSTYAQGAAGALNIEIGGTTVGTQFDQLAVTGAATLAGTLNVSLVSGFNPANGDSFTILTAASVTGNFTTTNLPALAGGLSWQVNVTANNVQLTVTTGGGGGAPTKLGFVVQPTNAGAGATIAPAVQVAVQDAGGATVAAATNSITLAIGNNPGAGTLSGTLTVAAVSGVATFNGLSIDMVGAGYTLSASAAGLTSATSSAFDISAGSATGLMFQIQPTDAAAGAIITPAVRVAVVDGGGNVVTGSTASISLAFGNSPQGAVLGGTTTVNAVAGQATFGDLSVDLAGTGYTLTASSAGLGGVTSSAFDISAGSAAALAFTVQPTNTGAGAAIMPAVQVAARDANGNNVAGFAGAVTVALSQNPGNATLSGTLTANAAGGVATFTNLSLDKVATGYTLSATAAGLTATTSSAFDISAGAVSGTNGLVDAAPSTLVADGAAQTTITVTVFDALNNPVAGLAGNQVNVSANPATGVIITQPVAATNATGQTTATATSTVGGTVTFSARVGGVDLTDTAQVTFNAAPVDTARSQVSIAPATIAANGQQQATVTVTLRDANDNPIGGNQPASRTLAVAAISGDATSVALASPGQATGTDGRFQATVTASAAGEFSLTLSIDGNALQSVVVTARQQFSTTLPAGLRFFGLPFQFDTPRPITVLGATGYTLARFDADTQMYDRFDASNDGDLAFAVIPGRGFWARFDANHNATGLGVPVPNAVVEMPLQVGWNALANPYGAALPWQLNRLEAVINGTAMSLADPATWAIVRPFSFIFDGTQYQLVFDAAVPGLQANATAVPVQAGFFIFSTQAGVRLRVQPPASNRSSAPPTPPGPNSWSASIQATSGSGSSSSVVVGVASSLGRSLAFERPPEPVPTDIELSLISDGNRASGELRTAAGDGVWPLQAVSRAAGDVTLSWPGLLRQLPRGVVLELTDQTSGERLLLNTRGSYHYSASQDGEVRSFTLRSRIGTITRSEIQSLSVAANRGDGTTVRLQLSGPADVTVTVRGLGGRLVRTIQESSDAAGPLAIVWDGNDERGRRAPAGTYQIEAVAVSDNGAVSRATRTVTVR